MTCRRWEHLDEEVCEFESDLQTMGRQTYDANLEVVSWAAKEGLFLLDWGFLWGHFSFCTDGDGGGEGER